MSPWTFIQWALMYPALIYLEIWFICLGTEVYAYVTIEMIQSYPKLGYPYPTLPRGNHLLILYTLFYFYICRTDGYQSSLPAFQRFNFSNVEEEHLQIQEEPP